jgi:hypothetical protein
MDTKIITEAILKTIEEKIDIAILKRATGYKVQERTTEEFRFPDSDKNYIKITIRERHVPPNLPAAMEAKRMRKERKPYNALDAMSNEELGVMQINIEDYLREKEKMMEEQNEYENENQY